MLTLDNVRSGYGPIEALRGVSLTVEQGAIVTLLGANGAGKTTLLRTISGVVRTTSGSMTYEGRRLDSAGVEAVVARGISHVPEGRQVFTDLTVHENLLLGRYSRRSQRGLDKDIARVYARFPRLKERSKQPAGTLSGGEQQMLAIGRALMAQPRLLLLDEPSLGLAPLLVKEIFGIIAEINREGTTILLVEQNAYLALSIAHYAYVLKTGHVAMHGEAAALRDDPEIRRSYLGR